MLVLHGNDKHVSCVRYGQQEVWTSGVCTAYNILKPYMQTTIVHVRHADDLAALRWNLRGVYVILSGPASLTEAVLSRGAYCIRDSFAQGLYRLRNI